MEPITATLVLLLVTGIVIALGGRRTERNSVHTAPPEITESTAVGGGAAGLLVILGIIMMITFTR